MIRNSGSFFSAIPPVTKNLIIINFIVWLAMMLMPGSIGANFTEYGGLHYIGEMCIRDSNQGSHPVAEAGVAAAQACAGLCGIHDRTEIHNRIRSRPRRTCPQSTRHISAEAVITETEPMFFSTKN